MTEYDALRLRRGTRVCYAPTGDCGMVLSQLFGWITVCWDDGTETELSADDFEDIALESEIQTEEIQQ